MFDNINEEISHNNYEVEKELKEQGFNVTYTEEKTKTQLGHNHKSVSVQKKNKNG